MEESSLEDARIWVSRVKRSAPAETQSVVNYEAGSRSSSLLNQCTLGVDHPDEFHPIPAESPFESPLRVYADAR